MIARMIYVKVPPEQIREAIEDWKQVCAPIMISQPGCLSEELLACNEQPDEFISLSNWESMEAIQAYRTSEAHERVKHSTRGIKAEVIVKTYKVVG
jgi:heme-degrading monooxygenase HmoA